MLEENQADLNTKDTAKCQTPGRGQTQNQRHSTDRLLQPN
jgi:hypothetical protein